jgi:hypothetical protein
MPQDSPVDCTDRSNAELNAERNANCSTSERAAGAGEGESLLEQELTVVLTTSPSPMCPSTELLETVLASLVRHAAGVSACRLILVCDGAKVGEKKQVFRSGHVHEASWAAYVEYKQRLHARARTDGFGFRRAEVLELGTHHGFGFAVCAALRLVQTRLVCVVQHDRALLRAVGLSALCDGLLGLSERVGYVLLPTRATSGYPERMRTKLRALGRPAGECNIEAHAIALPGRGSEAHATALPGHCSEAHTPHAIAPPATGVRLPAAGVRLLPCLTFYDSTHVARTDWYREFVFPRAQPESGPFAEPAARAYLLALPPEAYEKALVFGSGARLVTKGAFLEGELQPQQAEEVSSGGVEATLARWRTWLYDDGATPAVGHLNGAVARPWAAVCELHGVHGVNGTGQQWQRDAECAGRGACERDDASLPTTVAST